MCSSGVSAPGDGDVGLGCPWDPGQLWCLYGIGHEPEQQRGCSAAASTVTGHQPDTLFWTNEKCTLEQRPCVHPGTAAPAHIHPQPSALTFLSVSPCQPSHNDTQDHACDLLSPWCHR